MSETSSKPVRVLGVIGSLRPQSFNRGLIAAAARLRIDGVEVVEHDLVGIPMYDSALGSEVPLPETVASFSEAIAAADGVLVATPEYNYGIPGALKTAIDWVSRPAYHSVFAGKPTAVCGASMSPVGGARAIGQLKQVLLGLGAHVFGYPELSVGSAKDKFDDAGRLTDETTEKRITRLVGDFGEFCRRLRG